MFLERKFMTSRERHDILGDARLPERVQDVVHNVLRLLATERGVGHILPDYGFSQSGQWTVEGIIAHATAELRETLPRYESRLVIEDIEAELDDDGRPLLIVQGAIGAVGVTLTLDPVRRSVRAIRVV